jgi:hypothetical protein
MVYGQSICLQISDDRTVNIDVVSMILVIKVFLQSRVVIVVNTVSPNCLIENELFPKDGEHLLIEGLFLEQPVNGVEVEDLGVIQTVVFHELDDVFLASYSQDILDCVHFFLSLLDHNTELSQITGTGNQESILSDGCWVAGEVTNSWEVELEFQNVSAQRTKVDSCGLGILKTVHWN